MQKPLPMSISGYSLKEDCFYQHLYGVKIYSIGHEEEGLWWEDEGEGEELREKLLKEGKTYCILNSSEF